MCSISNNTSTCTFLLYNCRESLQSICCSSIRHLTRARHRADSTGLSFHAHKTRWMAVLIVAIYRHTHKTSKKSYSCGKYMYQPVADLQTKESRSTSFATGASDDCSADLDVLFHRTIS